MNASGQMIDDLLASPKPYHAVARASDLAIAAGFQIVDLAAPLPAEPGSYVAVMSGTLVAWVTGGGNAPGFTVVGAHTDSPNLRVRSNPDISSAGWAQVGMEVYGGVLLNSWLDRDLGLAGRVAVRSGSGIESRLVRDDSALLTIPQLAIHLDREIRDKGLLLNPQTHMTPIWARGDSESGDFRRYVAGLADAEPEQVVSWDLMAHDVQAPATIGVNDEFIASARIDNLFSSFCGLHALIQTATEGPADGRIPVLVLYDHEEVGSASATGAAGAHLSNVLERISASCGRDRVAHLEGLASSYVVSVDGAHATHPNYVDKHDPNHHIAVNAGVVVKRNSNQRYASDVASEGPFRGACVDAGIRVQTYVHRNDLPCGSTIGPITAAQLGVPTVDIGAAQLAMHSIRELAGVEDVAYLTDALAAMWRLA